MVPRSAHWHLLRQSLYRQFRLVFTLISFFVVIAAGPALVLTELSTGSGGAINVSGSLRMMSYRLTVAVSNPYSTHDERAQSIHEALEEFSLRLGSTSLTASVPSSPSDGMRIRYELVKKRFAEEIEPLALQSIDSDEARREFLRIVTGFVSDVDGFVFALEDSLSWRLSLLKSFLMLTLAGALGITFFLLRVLRRKVFEPLEELEHAAERVRGGDFTTRSGSAESPDEIGRFAQGFNFMVSELERLYGSLEAEVAKKTADLNRRNQGLEFLAHASEKLMVDGPKLAAAVADVLSGAAALAGARRASLYVAPSLDQGYQPQTAYLFAQTDAEAHPGDASLSFPAQGSKETAVGLLTVEFESAPDGWQRSFFEMTAGLVGRSVEAVLRVSDEQRLAVLEERSTIARELHDSIAQSLSFSKIQILRLRRALMPGAPEGLVQSVLEELDQGVSTAYRQLREVLTAFRLQLSGTGLSGAVSEAVDAFRSRTGLTVKLKNALIGVELSSNEQVHFIQILREALANVEKHARATEVEIRMERAPDGACLLQVADNGIGIPENAGKENHFGLGIMQERALALGAELSIRRRPEGGTLVEVRQPPRQAEAASQAGRKMESAAAGP